MNTRRQPADRMTPERVLELIAAFGADAGRWPEDERDAARRLLAAQPETFADALDAAARVDARLAMATLPDIPEALFAAIAGRGEVHLRPAARGRSRSAGGVWALLAPLGGGVAAMASLAAGLIVGMGGMLPGAVASGEDFSAEAVWAATGFEAWPEDILGLEDDGDAS